MLFYWALPTEGYCFIHIKAFLGLSHGHIFCSLPFHDGHQVLYGSTSDDGIFNATGFSRKFTMGVLGLLAPSNVHGNNDGYVAPFVFVGD